MTDRQGIREDDVATTPTSSTGSTAAGTAKPDAAPNQLRRIQYLGYASGDVANNLTFTLVSMFLLVYYTDVVGIAAGAAGTILFVARVWGAFTDVFAGRMVDKTNTRWGRFRPYFLFGAVPLMLLAVATFTVPTGFGDTFALVYAYVSYMLFYLVYSMVNIPYGSLASVMTQLPDERAKLSSMRTIGAAVSIIALNFAVAPQINSSPNLQRSLTITTLIVAVIGIALYWFLFATSVEKVQRAAGSVSLRQSVAAIGRNKALLLLCLSAILCLTGMFVLQTLQVYYARDVLGNANYTILLAVLTTGAMFVVSPLIPKIVSAFGKKRAYVVQTPGALDAIRYLTGLGPAIFVGLGAAVMLAYPLTEERFRTIVAELATRNADRDDRRTD